jgi:patatin-like phospholipase/acyl hydrolase
LIAGGLPLAFQILSLSGDGFLGLYTASVLTEIEERTGRPRADSFDRIAGTSVGGIIGLGLSAGRSAAEIKQAFLDEGDKIASPKRPASNFFSAGARILSGLS